MTWFQNTINDDKRLNRFATLLSVVLGFILGSIMLLIVGLNPLDMFAAILRSVAGISDKGFNIRYVGEFIINTMPLVLTGLSVAFAFRTGLFNIGAEGQMIMGAYAAVAVGLYFQLPAGIHVILCVLAAMVAGALWGTIPGFLKSKFNINEVVVSIMMNYTAMYLSNFLLKLIPGSIETKTAVIPQTALLKSDFLANLTNGSRLNWGIIIVVLAVIAFKIIMDKTTFGYELRAVGYNPFAAKYAGMKVNRNVVLSMAIAGAFAGLAGAVVSLGTFDFGRVISSFDNFGMNGIAVALIGGNTAMGTVFGGMLMGGLYSAQTTLQANGIPREISTIISALIVILIALKLGLTQILKRMGGQKK